MLRKPVGFAAARAKGAEGVVESAGGVGASAFPMNAERSGSPDTAALEAAWTTALSEGPVAHDLRAWRVPCLIFMAAADNDFLEQAPRAAKEVRDRRVPSAW